MNNKTLFLNSKSTFAIFNTGIYYLHSEYSVFHCGVQSVANHIFRRKKHRIKYFLLENFISNYNFMSFCITL
jgi:hypothetical protein